MSDNIFFTDGQDGDMARASEAAQKTFKYFWRELSWEYRRIVPALGFAVVKMSFQTDASASDAPSHEHMWVGDIDFDGDVVYGTLTNQPNWISTLKAGDTVSMPLANISDWMYSRHGKAYGAYTVQAMRAHMQAEERAQHDAAWGIEFPPIGQVEVTPHVNQEKKAGLLSGLFGRKEEAPPEDYPEHPMSESMADKIREGLQQHPSMITSADEQGWTMLHREALAGNLTPVKILLEHGADPLLKNSNGYSALDLATKMVWEKVIQVLKSIESKHG